MSNYRKHIFVGLLVILLIFVLTNHFFQFHPFRWFDWLILIPIIIFYAILPDVDHPSSKIRNFMFIFFFVGFIAILGSIIVMVNRDYPKTSIYLASGFGILQAFLALLIIGVKHRGAIHSVFAGLLFSLPILYLFNFNLIYFLVAWISYVSHLILDRSL